MAGERCTHLFNILQSLSTSLIECLCDVQAEVLLLDKLRHPNLVRLIGYCAERGEALLMYELCPHGSLDQRLFERKYMLHALLHPCIAFEFLLNRVLHSNILIFFSAYSRFELTVQVCKKSC